MNLILQIQLLPDDLQNIQLRTIVERFNEAANWIAGECFARKESNVFEVRKFAYAEVREKFGLKSQMAQLAIKNVCDVYKRDKSIRPVFRKNAAIVYDQRTMGFKGLDRVSLLTLDGRIIVPFIMGSHHAKRFKNAKGQADLVLREDGKWFLLVTITVPDGTPVPVSDFIGVDLGIVRLATDSDGAFHTGADVEKARRKYNLQRRRLQRRNTRGAKKKLKRVGKKEARFRKHVSHCISKQIVETARRTGRGIALENLKGIGLRITARSGEARSRLSGWGFAQLAGFVVYKAKLAGVPVSFVDPKNTSRTCSACGHCEKANRKSQSEFSCKACGFVANADLNAARNIRALGISKLPTRLVGAASSSMSA